MITQDRFRKSLLALSNLSEQRYKDSLYLDLHLYKMFTNRAGTKAFVIYTHRPLQTPHLYSYPIQKFM